jgi:photosystem II stability/assembly factor-like uncharacterized protein
MQKVFIGACTRQARKIANGIGLRSAFVFLLALCVIAPFSRQAKVSTNTNLEPGSQPLAGPQSAGWTTQTSGTPNNLFSVHFVNANEGWAVGFSNTILHTTNGGTNWTAQTNQGGVPVSSYLGVRFLDSNTGWAGGGTAVVRTTDGGASWVSQGATQDGRFRNNLFAVSSSAAWIPAQNATSTIRWFSRFTVGVGEENFNVIGSSAQYAEMYFPDQNTGWAVGSGPIVRISNASSASPLFGFQTSCPCPTLNGVYMLDTLTGWAVGNGGLILKTTDGGSTWPSQTSGITTNLRSVHFADSNQGWIVGNGGLILATTDGGTSWSQEASGVTADLRRVFFVDANTGYAVGHSGTILKRSVCVAPSISTHPSNQSVCGSSASFTVSATGTGLSYQWRKGGVPLFNGGNISGADTPMLTIDPASASDNGTYDVVVTGTCGSITSNSASLTVTTISLAPETLPNGIINTSYNQTITASGAAGPFSFTVTSGEVPTGLSLSTSGTLSGTPTVNGTFNFTVSATNGTCSGTRSYTLVIDRGWVPTSSMSTSRRFQTMTLLGNGKVLAAGGLGPGGLLGSAELYDPSRGNWTATNNMSVARAEHTATLLPNGKVLVVGGQPGLTSAEVYDPESGTWSDTGSMSGARYLHKATLLSDGRVLVTGGFAQGVGVLASAEIYNPATGSWTNANGMSISRQLHTATLLLNGQVLVVGGNPFEASAELFNPSTGVWAPTGSLAEGRTAHTANLLPNGRVLVAGGSTSGSFTTASAELYDPSGNGGLGSWSSAGSLNTARRFHSATLLPNGKVLVTGGYIASPALASTEMFDPNTAAGLGSWTYSSNLNTARAEPVATLLPSGRVLVAGGSDSSFEPLASAEFLNTAAGSWTATSVLGRPRGFHTATLLGNGRVLVAGGLNNGALAVTELYDPATGLWTDSGNLTTNRYYHTATLLADGKVLVTGGRNYIGDDIASAELYDLSTGMWTGAGNMNTARTNHTATLLPDGKVLVAGGVHSGAINSVEIFDPAGNGGLGSWSLGPSMNAARALHTATLVPDGRVLVVGLGTTSTGTNPGEIYDPAAGQWSQISSPNSPRVGHTATLLPNGKVLIASGIGHTSIPTAELYDPATGMWSAAGTTSIPHGEVSKAVLLPDGRVLITGGNNQSGPVSAAELYDPATNQWSDTVSLSTPRNLHTMTLLPNGKVLVAGGADSTGYFSSAQLYDIGLNFNNAWRPVLSSVNSPLSLGSMIAASGTQFRGISEASGGSFQNSSTDYPIVQIRSLANEQTSFLLSDPATNWSATAFTSRPLPVLPVGHALVTVFTNGIPSVSKITLINCSFAVSPLNPVHSASAGSGTINILASSGCNWTASSNASWITITSSNSGSGTGTVNYSYESNPGAERMGTLSVVGYTITIIQNCTAPVINSQPSNQIACAGSSASFSVAATGAGLTYQWRRSNVPLSDGGSISGSHTATLTINPVPESDSGLYDVVIDGACGSVTSGTAGLTINSATAISDHPGNLTKCIGQSAAFSVNATGTSLTYQWRKGVDAITGANSSSYTIASVSASDAGSYDVIVTGACGSVGSSAATLTVNAATQIDTNPSSQSVCVGASASFSVMASGAAPITYQWRKNGNDIAGATSSSYSIGTVVAGDAGSYDVIVTGPCGSIDSSAATLTVNSFSISPTYNSFPGNGGTGSINITVAGNCPWTAGSSDSWVTITSGASGSGNGSVNYSVALNPSSQIRSGTISVAGQVYTVYQGINFLDVPSTHPFYAVIGKLSARGVTLGCGGGNYCPDAPVLRDQMAAFILRALGEFNPATPATQRFADVPPTNVFYAFIDELADRQITLGCGGGNYCPTSPVLREQMAAFLMRALGEFNPPTPNSQRFDDVPPSNPFYNFIERLAARQITLGCSQSPPLFCPKDVVRRDQMAAFLVRAFSL